MTTTADTVASAAIGVAARALHLPTVRRLAEELGAGMAACHQGCAVRYITAAGLVNELVETQDTHQPSKIVARCGRYDLLVVDERGYLHLDPRAAELLFQALTEREERASIAVATNLPFSEWATTFTDPRLCAAIIDRLTFNALIIETGSVSYRLHATRKAAPRT